VSQLSVPHPKERVAKTIEFIKAIKPAQIDGSEDKEITMKFTSGERKFSGQSLVAQGPYDVARRASRAPLSWASTNSARRPQTNAH
jgi:Domain of unknown function (DUF1993)